MGNNKGYAFAWYGYLRATTKGGCKLHVKYAQDVADHLKP